MCCFRRSEAAGMVCNCGFSMPNCGASKTQRRGIGQASDKELGFVKGLKHGRG